MDPFRVRRGDGMASNGASEVDGDSSVGPTGRLSHPSWVVACVGGWLVGGVVGALLGSFWTASIRGGLVVAAAASATGVGQALVLRRCLPRSGSWFAATLVAVALASVLVVTVDAIDAGAGVALGGLVLGVCQWVVLRRRTPRAAWWVPTSAVAWVLGGLLSGAVGPPAGWVVIGAVYGLVTAPVLGWILARSGARS